MFNYEDKIKTSLLKYNRACKVGLSLSQYVAEFSTMWLKFWQPSFSHLFSAQIWPSLTTHIKLNKFTPDLLVFRAYSRLEVRFNKSQLEWRLSGEICIDLWSGLEMYFLILLFIYLSNHYLIRQVSKEQSLCRAEVDHYDE